jgi:hypothetical protein
MNAPIEIEVDPAVGAGYVRYRELPKGEYVARCVRFDADVVVDYSASGDLIGLEVLELDQRALDVARAFAEQNGCAFPADSAMSGLS